MNKCYLVTYKEDKNYYDHPFNRKKESTVKESIRIYEYGDCIEEIKERVIKKCEKNDNIYCETIKVEEVKYVLLEAGSSKSLECKVNNWIRKGWSLLGGVSIGGGGGGDSDIYFVYVQGLEWK